ncbi:MAG: pyridoxine 5'-phosphate synthase [Vampirovibrionales bacterium]|nr:pyridoxine 5'-phosphate synthase [Vampirovibrionales bacterium]
MVLLGVNIDHIATLRNARGAEWPSPVAGAILAEQFGADGITAHLREDRRHIRDDDMSALRASIKTRLNMEMALTDEMVAIALKIKPEQVTLVPERREELTTEGGLDVKTLSMQPEFQGRMAMLRDANIAVSLFIDADESQVRASHASGAGLIEFHTGQYADAFAQSKSLNPKAKKELASLVQSAHLARELGLIVNAGHGLTFDNVIPILTLPGLHELNIGHFLISQAVFDGLGPVVAKMKALIS